MQLYLRSPLPSTVSQLGLRSIKIDSNHQRSLPRCEPEYGWLYRQALLHKKVRGRLAIASRYNETKSNAM